eukprot:UN21077
MCALGRSLHFEAKAISEMKKRPFFDLGPTIMHSKRRSTLLSRLHQKKPKLPEIDRILQYDIDLR